MGGETPETMGWALAVGLAVALVLLGAAGWWLFRKRRRTESRAAFAEELRGIVDELGLEGVWHAALFQSDIFGIRGTVDGFDVRAEQWEAAGRDLFRLSVYFPQSSKQTIKIFTRRRTMLEQMRGFEEVELGDGEFDDRFNVFCHLDDVERVPDVLVTEARRRLLTVGRQVDGVKIADRSMYMFAEKALTPSSIQTLIDEAVTIGSTLYERAKEVGPAEAARRTTQYEIASSDVLGRETGEFDSDEVVSQGADAEEITEEEGDDEE